MCSGCVRNGYVSQDVYDKIEAFLVRWPEAESGHAHAVLALDNVEDDDIEGCLEALDDPTNLDLDCEPESGQTDAIRAFLKELLTIPETERAPYLKENPRA